MKIRFIEPGNRPYKPTPLNYFVYDRYIRTPSVGLNTLATIVKKEEEDTLMYSEAISRIPKDDILDADVIFIGIFTFAAVRGYQIARYLKKRSRAVIVMGGLHASMNYKEAVRYCDYVLIGEGDETILTFLRALKNKKPMDFPGIAYRRNGKMCIQDTLVHRRILRQSLTVIWCTGTRKWPGTALYGRRCMHPEDVRIIVIIAL